MRTEIVTRKADISDAHAIMKEPSLVTVEESNRHGGILACLEDMNELFETGSADVVLENGNPLFLFGHTPEPLCVNVRNNWFIAKQRYFDCGIRIVVYSRRYLRNEQAKWPTTTFVSCSCSSHPATARWFKALGFQEDIPRNAPGIRFFVLRPRVDGEIR